MFAIYFKPGFDTWVLAPSDHDRVKITLVLNLLYLYGDRFLFEYL